jgi:hypothetical protein
MHFRQAFSPWSPPPPVHLASSRMCSGPKSLHLLHTLTPHTVSPPGQQQDVLWVIGKQRAGDDHRVRPAVLQQAGGGKPFLRGRDLAAT